ncbi:MAG: 4-hydroxybenzoate octaprenyltransferase [Pseudomonadota bacterium]
MNKPHTDIKTTGWIERWPLSMRPYALLMRLDRPIGIWLLLLPAWWSIAAAGGGANHMKAQDWWLMALFGCGAIIMRGAGCIINDMWDRDFDKQVERTRLRPLAAGTISLKKAFAFLSILLCLGLFILLQLSLTAQIIGVLSLIPVILYPLAKRVTWYPQAILGLTFNIGALMGWAAMTNTVPLGAWIIYMAGIFWTLGYDTIYAHQDIADDGIVGIKSTALKFGKNSRLYISGFYASVAILLYSAGILLNDGPIYFILWGAASGHLLWQLYDWDINNPTDCLRKFRSNRLTGWLILAAFLGGYLI